MIESLSLSAVYEKYTDIYWRLLCSLRRAGLVYCPANTGTKDDENRRHTALEILRQKASSTLKYTKSDKDVVCGEDGTLQSRAMRFRSAIVLQKSS